MKKTPFQYIRQNFIIIDEIINPIKIKRPSDEDLESKRESFKQLDGQKNIPNKSVVVSPPSKQIDKKITITSNKEVKTAIKNYGISKTQTKVNETLVRKDSNLLSKVSEPEANNNKNNSKKESCKKSKQDQNSKTTNQKIKVTSELNSNVEKKNQEKNNKNTLISIKNGDFRDNTNVCQKKNCNCKKKHISTNLNENNQVNTRQEITSDQLSPYKKSDDQINIENYVSKNSINTFERREKSDIPISSINDLEINSIRKVNHPTEPNCEEEKKNSVNPSEKIKENGEKPIDYIRKKNSIETNENENCDSNENDSTVRKSLRKEKSYQQTDNGKGSATSSYKRTSYNQNEIAKKEIDLSEEECNTNEESKLKGIDNITLEKNPLPENINLANINNINAIEAKNTLNNVQKVYKNQIKTEHNNLIFNNHIMVNGLVETSKLTGGCLIPLDKLMKVINKAAEIKC